MQRFLASGLVAAVLFTAGASLADSSSDGAGAHGASGGGSSVVPNRTSPPAAEPRSVRDGRAVVGMMEGTARGLQDLLVKTRHTQDARTIACVSDSLSQANVLTRRAKDRFAVLREAAQRGDQPAQALLLALIQEDRAIEREAGKTAFACVGVLVAPRGKDLVSVKMIVDKNIPPELPSERP